MKCEESGSRILMLKQTQVSQDQIKGGHENIFVTSWYVLFLYYLNNVVQLIVLNLWYFLASLLIYISYK
jgi:hypothetical protein